MSLRRPTTKERLEALVLLADAVELIGERRRWTQRTLARDRHSHPVLPVSERAVRWCLGGALYKVASERIGYQFEADAEGSTMPTSLRLAFLEVAKTAAVFIPPIDMVGSEEFLVPTGGRRRKRTTSWQLVYGLNDGGFPHEVLLKLVAVTLKRLDRQISRSSRRTPKRLGGAGERKGGKTTP